MSTYVIDTAALVHNIDVCRRVVTPARVYGVVKGDGYGLGLLPYSRILSARGVDALAVTEGADALALRQDGFAGEILMMRATTDADELQELMQAQAVFTVGSMESYAALDMAAAIGHADVQAHLYVDTGMGREGFSPNDDEKLHFLCVDSGKVHITGLYTHFPMAEQDARDTKTRFISFMRLVHSLKADGWHGTVHCASSCAALRYPEMRLDAVRIGSAFLGRLPFQSQQTQELKKIGYIETELEATRWLAPGDTVGYGSSFRAQRKTQIGLLNIGYYNGFGTERNIAVNNTQDLARALLTPMKTLLRGKEKTASVNGNAVNVVGSVGMQNTILDITGANGKVHDKVILECNPLMIRNIDREFR